MSANARGNAGNTAFAAILMIFYGFYFSGVTGISNDRTYNMAVEVFPWALRIGGAIMLLAAGLSYLGQRVGLLLDCLATGASGAILGICSLIWLTKGSSLDIQDLVVLAFSLLLIRAAWIAWTMFAAPDSPTAPPPPAAPEPVHPASIHPDSLPKDGEPPPPDGYLAALANEKDEPPTASYE